MMLVKAQTIKPKLVELRREIHRHPELGFDLYRTAGLVARSLEALGVEVQIGVGKTGVVGKLGKKNGRVVALRADMDALPILEANTAVYASAEHGKMHACGHDSHTAMLIGVATLLAKEDLPGEVRLIFQPSEEGSDEEGLSGARRMVDEGALDGVDYVAALHVDSELDTGMVNINTGPISAAVDRFTATITGKGSHGAYPHNSIDPFWLTAQVLNALYAVPSRRVDPVKPSVLSLGIVRGGTASNIIPEEVYLEGTLRSMDENVRQQLVDEVRRSLEIARSLGGDYVLGIDKGYPPVNNHAQVAALIRSVITDELGQGALAAVAPGMGAEDFAYMTSRCPGAMFDLGAHAPGTPILYAHTSTFDIDEDALPIGTALLAETALRLLKL
jgi:amidohydrolase